MAKKKSKNVLIVDGYNVIHQDEGLSRDFRLNPEDARYGLVEMLSNYQGYKKDEIIVIFDAYNTDKALRSLTVFSNVNVVFTKHGETADEYIERFVSTIENRKNITVVTNDNVIAVLTTGRGCSHMSAEILFANMAAAVKKNKEYISKTDTTNRGNTLESLLDEKTLKWMEENRRR